MYKLIIRKSAENALEKLSERDFAEICCLIESLAQNPRPDGTVKLMGNIYRLRKGDYRIIYIISEEEKLVDIGKITRRRERTYKEIKKLFG